MIELQRVYEESCLETMEKLPEESIDLISTDPPYSLNYNFIGDKMSYEEQFEFMKLYSEGFYRVLKHGSVVTCFMSQEMSHYLFFAMKKAGFTWQNEIIWNRDGGQMPKKKFGICHERIMVFSKGKDQKTFNLDDLRVKSKYAGTDKRLNPKGKNPGDVWYVPALFGKKLERIVRADGKAAHPTQKPIHVILPLVMAYSNPGELVYDPFTGSGTTYEACERLGRAFVGSEVSGEYCQMAMSRIKNLS